ncbi:MAG: hypothetical protein ABI597_04200 [Gammaproteobacteria bacterium]
MQHFIKTIGLMSLILTISGCSHVFGNHGVIQDRGSDYLKAKSIPPLRIPPGLSSSTIEASYPVSDRYYPTGDKPLNLIPPELNNSGN